MYPLNVRIDAVESRLKKQFKTFKVSSEPELQALLKNEHFLCIVIGCNVREAEDIKKIRKICPATPKIPCLIYENANEREFIFQLAKDGLDTFSPNANIELLLEKLHHYKDKATFRIDLREFGIDLTKYQNYWTRKFLDFIIKDYNFWEYRTINEIAKQLAISPSHLFHCFKKDYELSPKQLLLCLQNYYAAYLLDTTEWSLKNVAERCGFANEHTLFKSFKHKTGITVLTFRRDKHWRDYPRLCMENISK